MKISKDILFSILSGVMIGTSYIPFPPWALFFCLIPLWSRIVQQNSYKKAFWMAWTTQFVLALIGFHWIPYTIVEFGHMPYFVGALGLLAFAALTNLHIPFAAVVCLFLSKKNPHLSQNQKVLLLAALTALLEKINPQIFPWHLGYPWMYGGLPAYHTADLIGFSGLSTLTYLINAWILVMIWELPRKVIFKKHVSSFLILFSILNLIGYYQKSKWNNFDSQVNILAVQPNIGNQEKQFQIFGSGFKSQVIQQHLDLTRLGLQSAQEKSKQVDLVLWPETSIPEYLDLYFHRQKNVQRILEFIKEIKVPVLSGAYSHNLKTFQDSNSLFLFDEQAQLQGLYKKHQLLAFGEYLPFSDYFPSLLKLLPTVANFERGPGPQTMNFKNLKLGLQICYEGLHPWFTNKLSNLKADIIVNVTNDSWFGHTFEPSQHMFMTFARSIEVRRPMVRATNTGITSAILANGDILQLSPQIQAWAGVFEIQYKKSSPQTFFAIFPYVDVLFCLLFIGIMILRKHYDRLQKP